MRLPAAFSARTAAALAAAAVAAAAPASASARSGFLGPLHRITPVASTVPAAGAAAGDVNPYGVAVVPRTVGDLTRGDVLVSNFNDSQNLQGTGSSIVEVSPSGAATVFAVVPAPTSIPAVGLTTALAILPDGDVVVGSLPAPNGVLPAVGPGALTILNPDGQVVETITAPDINGPWDLTAVGHGGGATLFVTNVLNGTVAANGQVVDQGTVVRITLAAGGGWAPRVTSNQVIATGFAEHTDPNALVVGPTGVGLGAGDTLYVADSNGNRIAAIPHAMTRMNALGAGGLTVSQGGALNDPLGLTIAPGGDIISANGDDGNIVETSPFGHTVAVKTLVADGAGDLFGLAVAPGGDGLYFVNDAGSGPAANSLDLLR
ncbi:MAG: hypothetical protein ABSH51_03195 [Solirubrobacteraceae bacterium]|jgi:hypothetical protein